MSQPQLRLRVSLTELQTQYENGNKKPLETLMRAWKGIKELRWDDPNSFFAIGGLHGEPFRGAGWSNPTYWGGYCNHGNVLFPVWHRAYLIALERALRNIPGCEDVALPFWDETAPLPGGNPTAPVIPWALTNQTFELDGKSIPNPLASFKFTQQVTDNTANPNGFNYSKPLHYETVRYPLSGLVGTPQDQKATDNHNKQFPDWNTNVQLLNQNVLNWLGPSIIVNKKPVPANVYEKFHRCLDAPNYTLFSNTTSETEWNNNYPNNQVVALEDPHNDIHLAVGGFEWPGNPVVPGQNVSPIDGANGDMGENDTASMDPIFFFHHCFIDYVFWRWQKKNGFTDRFDIIPWYPGTNSVDSQGPTPGVPANSLLTMDSKLDPWSYTARDMINIESQLGYTYGSGSLDDVSKTPAVTFRSNAAESPSSTAVENAEPTKTVVVSGVDRGTINGSFVIAAFANVNGKRELIGAKSILSRWKVQGCANCLTHLEARAHFPVKRSVVAELPPEKVQIEIRTRNREPISETASLPATPFTMFTEAKKRFRVQVI
ncbi:MAG: pigment biosynthesis-related tyrosinase [Nitrospira sp.]